MNTAGDPAPGATVAVAFSGGRDSLALLHATAQAARTLGLRVVALHVHHGLVEQADAWVASASRLCQRWRGRGLPVSLRWHALATRPAPGDSIEAWARRERYAALTAMAKDEGATLVLLAHHRRDQAETVLLQALRGAGPRGLAAMPESTERAGLTWARPWLHQRREAIDAYVRRYRLRPIEDPSNDDQRLQRNRLRLRVWPALMAGFADAETALAAVAQRAQEADAALSELARSDLSHIVHEDQLRVAGWLALSPARRANALRAWLTAQWGRGPPETLVQRLMVELPGLNVARWPTTAGCGLQLYRGRLSWVCSPAPSIGHAQRIDLSRPGTVVVPGWGGAFDVRSVDEKGLDAVRLAAVELRPRSGGERFLCSPRGRPQSLKKQFQAAGIAAAVRVGPLVWSGEELLFVPGLGIDARRWKAPGEAQLGLSWQPDPR